MKNQTTAVQAKETKTCFKVAVLALCALLLAVCLVAATLSAKKGEASANAGSVQNNTNYTQNDASPRAVNGTVSFTVDGGAEQTGTLGTAIQEINKGNSGSITLTQDVDINYELTAITKDVALNLAAFKLTVSGTSEIGDDSLKVQGSANLTVTGTTGEIFSPGVMAIMLDGTGTVIVNSGTVRSNYGIYGSYGNIEINGGLIETIGLDSVYSAVESFGFITVTGGTIQAGGDATAITNYTGSVIITGGIIASQDGSAINCLDIWAQVTVSGNARITTVNGEAIYGITGVIKINGGTVEATGPNGYGIFNSIDSNIYVTGGTVTAIGPSIYHNNGIINISGGTVRTVNGYAIEVVDDKESTFTVSGGTVEATGEGTAIRINTLKATTNITGGTITAHSANAVVNVGKLYLSGTPLITSEKKYAIETDIPIYGADQSNTAQYTGDVLSMNYTGAFTLGSSIVYNNTNLRLFLLINAGFTLDLSGNNLVAQPGYAITLHYGGVLKNALTKVIVGEKMLQPTVAASGFVLAGFYADSEFLAKFNFDAAIPSDTDIYVKWTLDVAELRDIDTVYDGQEHSLPVVFRSVSDNFTYTYAWTKSGNSTVISTLSALPYKLVSDSGDYTCRITATPKTGSGTYTASVQANITIVAPIVPVAPNNSALNLVLLIDNLILILLIVATVLYIVRHRARKRQKALAEADKL